jgi:hypothetical protein
MRNGPYVALTWTVLALVSASSCTHASAAGHATYGLGRAADPAAVARIDIDIAPDGTGLPDGRGDAAHGAEIFAASCRACHGIAIRLDRHRWRYATTLFDFMRRAMPPRRTAQLSANDFYALTAYELFMNGTLQQDESLDRASLPRVKMPGSTDFIEQP